MSIPEPRVASRKDKDDKDKKDEDDKDDDGSCAPAPNPSQKAAAAKTKTTARPFIAPRPSLPSMAYFDSGKNFCKGRCSHRGCDYSVASMVDGR
jgi:hypothetical protein